MDGAGLAEAVLLAGQLSGYDVVRRAASGSPALEVLRAEADALELVAEEVRMIKEVEEVHAEFDVVAFLDVPVFGELHVHVAVVGPEAIAARGIADGTENVANKSERSGIQNLSAIIPGVATYASDIGALVISKTGALKGVHLVVLV